MDADDRQRLIHAAKAGDPDAFARLLDHVTVRLYVYIRRTGARAIGADADADDIFQLTAERAWRLIGDFEEEVPDGFFRWLVAIARGVCSNRADYLAAKGRRETRHAESVIEGGGDRRAYDSATSLSSIVARREEIKRLERALAALAPDARALVELTVLEGAAVSEAAAALGLKKSTAWDQLTRAMEELRRYAS